MELSITQDQLVAEAALFGRGLRDVQTAVTDRLISKPWPTGRGRGRGVEWRYSPGTDVALRTGFRLRDQGYRGDALYFALWWRGVVPWRAYVAKYVVSIFMHAQTALSADIRARVQRATVAPAIEVGGTETAANSPTASALGSLLDAALSPAMLDAFGRLGALLDPGNPLTPAEIRSLSRVLSAGIAGIYPEDIDAGAWFLEDWLMPETLNLTDNRQVVQTAVSATVRKLHEPEWWTESLGRLERYRSTQYDVARGLVTTRPGTGLEPEAAAVLAEWRNRGLSIWPHTRLVLGTVKSITRQLYPKLSLHRRQRLGSWNRPALAARGFLVGLALIGLGSQYGPNT